MNQLERQIQRITAKIPTSVIETIKQQSIEAVRNSKPEEWKFDPDFCEPDDSGNNLDIVINGPDGINFCFKLSRSWMPAPGEIELQTSWTLAKKGWELAKVSPPDGNVKFFPDFKGEEIATELQTLLERISADGDFKQAKLPKRPSTKKTDK